MTLLCEVVFVHSCPQHPEANPFVPCTSRTPQNSWQPYVQVSPPAVRDQQICKHLEGLVPDPPQKCLHREIQEALQSEETSRNAVEWHQTCLLHQSHVRCL